MNELIPIEAITGSIYQIRGHKVMLDRDLAKLYKVETRVLTQAVRRNIRRFPDDFMFVLKEQEFNLLMSQSVISKSAGRGGTRKPPMAFTEQGVAMLSTVLNSERAIEVNIAIMRAFVRMRELLATNKKMARKLDELEKRLTGHDEQFQMVFEAIRQLIEVEEKPKKKIGF
jgi:phage regulator Rha-like protein